MLLLEWRIGLELRRISRSRLPLSSLHTDEKTPFLTMCNNCRERPVVLLGARRNDKIEIEMEYFLFPSLKPIGFVGAR